MRQTLFTAYANLSLRDNPKDLKLFPQILHKLFPYQIPVIFEILITLIIDFVQEKDMFWAEGVRDSFKRKADSVMPGGAYEIAFEAVYGYQDGYCRDFSDYGQAEGSYLSPCAYYLPGRHDYIDSDFVGGPNERPGRLKCFECEQLFVREILQQIIEGKELTEIYGLKEFLQSGLNHNQGTITLTDGKIEVTKIWEGLNHNSGSFMQGPDPDHPYKHVFNQYLRSMIAYDLGACLADDPRNRNKIKCCSKCNIFYISETSVKRELNFCCDQCRYNYHNTQRMKEGYFKSYKEEKGFYKYE